MCPPSYRWHDPGAGFNTELGISAEGNWRKYLQAAEVGRGHSSEESCRNSVGAKDPGYWVKIYLHNLKGDDLNECTH